ncbi:MAG: hypothetical protein ACHQX3_00525 [Nitrospirales bacterium]
MSSRKRDSRQSIFNFGDDPPVESVPTIQPAIWRDVTPALFLSWSRARQLDYCARRDEDSAAKTDGDERQFYLQRAQDYRHDLRAS